MDRFTGLSALFRHRGISTVVTTALLAALCATTPSAAATLNAHVAAAACNRGANAVVGAQRASELITVVAPSVASQTASVQLFRRSSGCFRAVAGPYGAFVGRNGLSSHHVEGDGTTPMGLFAVGLTMYGVSANPGVRYRYHRLVCGDWWDEDPRSFAYNRFVHVACDTTPSFAGNSEALWQNVPAYNYFAVIEYNTSPVVASRGSGIFLHVAKGDPTTGCVSVAKVSLVKILRLLHASLHPMIDITTTAQLQG
jgi:L,D-peptidoglycan transpeptidase YkuD (ErfK/YbiS/YcfS/YnhG family)